MVFKQNYTPRASLVMTLMLSIFLTMSCQAPLTTQSKLTTTQPKLISAKEAYDLALPVARVKMAEACVALVSAGTSVPSSFVIVLGAGVSITTPQVPEGRSNKWRFVFCPVALPQGALQNVGRLQDFQSDMTDVSYLVVSIEEGEASAEYAEEGSFISLPFGTGLWQVDSPEAVKTAQAIADTEEKQSERRYILSRVELFYRVGTGELTWVVKFVPKSPPQREGLTIYIDATTGKFVESEHPEYVWS